MYQLAYVEQLEETPRDCRDRERHAFDQAIELLQRAEKDGVRSPASAQALHFLCRLWQVLIDDLVAPDNDLPAVLRADLISIGIWMIKESDSIRSGHSSNYRGLIEICVSVRDGLK
jgi:flagellar protein FlaF